MYFVVTQVVSMDTVDILRCCHCDDLQSHLVAEAGERRCRGGVVDRAPVVSAILLLTDGLRGPTAASGGALGALPRPRVLVLTKKDDLLINFDCFLTPPGQKVYYPLSVVSRSVLYTLII